ncbi:AmmeMemoRadiSam system radical SAM enzyme [Verrucomicrobiota bacterium]
MKTALFWHKTESANVQCELCPHHCVLKEGRTGLCRIRHVRDGELKAGGYGLISSLHVDPIEKKPLYHFYPTSDIFSIGGWGCSLACKFCQNWTISQNLDERSESREPDEVIQAASRHHSVGVAYTYNEPLINIEFVHDCAVIAREHGLVNVLVTNGFIEEPPAAHLLPFIDALNIDIKSMDDKFYRKECKGTLDPVLRFCQQAVAAGCHVEITNLLIPNLNDTEEQVSKLSGWIGKNLGRKTPLHLSAYRPEFKMNLPPTAVETLEQVHGVCSRDLDYVYIGNARTRSGQDTRCPQCQAEWIVRQGYATTIVGLVDHACAQCGRHADIVFSRT